MPDWQTIAASIAALIVLVLGSIGVGAKSYIAAWFEERKKRIGQKQNYDGMAEFAGIYNIADILAEEDFVDRIILFNGSNGGGVPAAGSSYYVTAIAGYSSIPGVHPERPYSGKLPVDGHYINLLLQLCKTGTVLCTTAEMPDRAYLRAYYEKEGVKQSIMLFLKLDNTKLVYFSVANYKREFTPAELSKIEMAALQARIVMRSELPKLD